MPQPRLASPWLSSSILLRHSEQWNGARTARWELSCWLLSRVGVMWLAPRFPQSVAPAGPIDTEPIEAFDARLGFEVWSR